MGLQGDHSGFDNMLPGIRSFFYMTGPSFKVFVQLLSLLLIAVSHILFLFTVQKNVTIPGFESVHIYELMCKLLNLRPAPNNGSIDVFSPALLDNGRGYGSSIMFVIVLVSLTYRAFW